MPRKLVISSRANRPSDDSFSDEETQRRAEAALCAAFNKPSKPQSEMKLGKPRAKKSASPPNKNATKGGMRK
jgi:hypothetical protein